MKRLTVITMLALLCAGCNRWPTPVCVVVQCWPKNERIGFMSQCFRPKEDAGTVTGECFPCEQATTPEALFVCYGRTYTARTKP